MTLVLKSDKALTAPVLTGIESEAVLSLDFKHKQYIKNGVKADNLTGIIATTSAAGSGYYSNFGVYDTALVNENVVSTDLNSFDRGLLVEGASINFFTQSFNPVSKTVSITTDRVNAYIVSMIGTGSLQVSIDGATSVTVTENKPLGIPSTETTITSSVAITVVGDVSYVGVEKTPSTAGRVTRIPTTTTFKTFVPPIVQIEPALLESLLTNFEGCIVIRQHIPTNVVPTPSLNRQTIAIMSILDSTDKGIFAAKGISSPYQFALRTINGAQQISESQKPQDKTIVTALNFSKTSAKMVVNSTIVGNHTFDSVNLSRIFLGSSPTWSATDASYITEVLLFNRQLSDDELKEITAVWA